MLQVNLFAWLSRIMPYKHFFVADSDCESTLKVDNLQWKLSAPTCAKVKIFIFAIIHNL